ncbi:MAG: Crp/Fnr family transcriptional regulator [Pseudomonadota bacterium]
MKRREYPFQTFETAGNDRVVSPGTVFLREGEKASTVYLVRKGLGLRSKSLSSGRRQVVGFMMPGDFVGLQGKLSDGMGHSAEATTEMRLSPISHSDVQVFFDENPRKALELARATAEEEKALGEALTALGQRDAIARVAWLLASFYERMREQDIGADGIVPMPWRQQDVADALGLSLVHTNKTLARLRKDDIAVIKSRTLQVFDLPALKEKIEEDGLKAA